MKTTILTAMLLTGFITILLLGGGSAIGFQGVEAVKQLNERANQIERMLAE